MATPWTFEQRLAAYRAEGITDIVVMSGAKTHNRDDETGRAFGPVYGVTIHHTAGVSSGMKDVIYNGVSGLPGPLAQDFLAKDGTLYVVGHGRCNHAGSVTAAVKASIIAERQPNLNDRTVGSETEDGNDFLYGLEIENEGDGNDPYPAKQYDVAVRWAAAHLRFHGWVQNSAWGHKEITGRKIDPSFSMNAFRDRVQARLANEEGAVAIDKADVGTFANTDEVFRSPDDTTSDNKFWTLNTYQRETYLRAREAKGLAQGAAAAVALARADIAEVAIKVDALATGGVDLDALAVKVADEIYKRMAG
jgi:hypothetical protein